MGDSEVTLPVGPLDLDSDVAQEAPIVRIGIGEFQDAGEGDAVVLQRAVEVAFGGPSVLSAMARSRI